MQDYTLHARTLADCVIRYYERFRPDAVWLSADTWVTAQAMGARWPFPARANRWRARGALRAIGRRFARIPPPDPGSQGRFPLMLEALGRIREALGEGLRCGLLRPVSVLPGVCLDGHPAGHVAARGRPCPSGSLMEKCSAYAVAYARALAAAGADMLSGGDSPAGLIGPRLYRDVALPFERRVVSALKAELAVPVSLHICGNAMPILADMVSSGADVLELDHYVDITSACRVVGSKVAIWGNLDPVGLLARGTPEEVRKATQDLIRAAGGCGHERLVASSGCTLAPDTPAENLAALIETATRRLRRRTANLRFQIFARP